MSSRVTRAGWRTVVIALIAGAAAVCPAAAQVAPSATHAALGGSRDGEARLPEVQADRPDFTDGTQTLPVGLVQFEGGLSYTADRSGGVDSRNVTAPGGLLRIGISRALELRVGGDGLLTGTVGGSRTSGYSDLAVSVKLHLFEVPRLGVDLALLPELSLPVGAESFSSETFDPLVKVALARELAGGFDVSGNLNTALVSDAAGRFRQHAVSLSVSHALAGGDVFAEVYRVSRPGRDNAAAVTFDCGIARGIGSDLMVDVEAGRGLTETADDWFVGVGFTVRGLLRR